MRRLLACCRLRRVRARAINDLLDVWDQLLNDARYEDGGVVRGDDVVVA
jgi:hypothetical protein